MIVVKFGGTSVGDADAIRRSAEIVRGRLDRKPIVVVSALAGTTNALIAIAEQAARGQLIGAVRNVQALRERHLEEAERLLGDTPECADVSSEMSVLFDELASLAEALSVLGDLTPRSLDAIAAAGENGDDRAAVVDQVFATKDRDSVLGSYSIDENGDTTLTTYGVYRIQNNETKFDRTIKPPS